jgi:hypothetical protein
MTYYGGKELAASFRTVRENTVKIAEEIPENKYDFRLRPTREASARRSRTSRSAPASRATSTATRSPTCRP